MSVASSWFMISSFSSCWTKWTYKYEFLAHFYWYILLNCIINKWNKKAKQVTEKGDYYISRERHFSLWWFSCPLGPLFWAKWNLECWHFLEGENLAARQEPTTLISGWNWTQTTWKPSVLTTVPSLLRKQGWGNDKMAKCFTVSFQSQHSTFLERWKVFILISHGLWWLSCIMIVKCLGET